MAIKIVIDCKQHRAILVENILTIFVEEPEANLTLITETDKVITERHIRARTKKEELTVHMT
jgi:hypothetical protein